MTKIILRIKLSFFNMFLFLIYSLKMEFDDEHHVLGLC